MTNEVDAVIEAQKSNGDSCADAFAAVWTICVLVATVVFWLHNQ